MWAHVWDLRWRHPKKKRRGKNNRRKEDWSVLQYCNAPFDDFRLYFLTQGTIWIRLTSSAWKPVTKSSESTSKVKGGHWLDKMNIITNLQCLKKIGRTLVIIAIILSFSLNIMALTFLNHSYYWPLQSPSFSFSSFLTMFASMLHF